MYTFLVWLTNKSSELEFFFNYSRYAFDGRGGMERRKSHGNCPLPLSHQSAFSWELVEGVKVTGNINTLACMNVRSGRLAITLMASSLRCSSLFGFLLTKREVCSCGSAVDQMGEHSLSRWSGSHLCGPEHLYLCRFLSLMILLCCELPMPEDARLIYVCSLELGMYIRVFTCTRG